ncbi:MAG: M20/M25/M40 family metallo-hydrolase, partial [Gallicola sp.]|nr:M20/M25/M40 family metallo-hydrolase [Gallicola sp.]
IIKGDTRSFSPKMQKLIEDRMREVAVGISKLHGATCEFEYTHEFSPTINWDENYEYFLQAAKNIFGEENVNGQCEPWMGSEDFGIYLEHVPGAFLFLGSGKSSNETVAPLHNASYDYNDDILVPGAKLFSELVRLRLPK